MKPKIIPNDTNTLQPRKSRPTCLSDAGPIDILGGHWKGSLKPGQRKAILDAELGDNKPGRFPRPHSISL